MNRSINIVDKNNELIASISNGDIVFHGDCKIVDADVESETEMLRPEVSV